MTQLDVAQRKDQATDLASWIYPKVELWEQWRDNNYKERWNSYYRSYRGTWIGSDKNNEAEKSRIITPELATAVETMVSELEEATFIRERWVSLLDDFGDQNKKDLEAMTELLLEDMSQCDIPSAISETFLNAALYGTGIMKVAVVKKKIPVFDNYGNVSFKEVYVVEAIPISPRNFVIEPSANSINSALGCAHICRVPVSEVQRRRSDGTYRADTPLAEYGETIEDTYSLGELAMIAGEDGNGCKITEWHGLVPKEFLEAYTRGIPKSEFVDILGKDGEGTLDTTVDGHDDYKVQELVEAVVTLVNDNHVVKAVANPFTMGDRSIVAYQHDTVPNRFWGRGVCEKGYNPAKALEAETRARIDSLKLSTYPMMAIDATKVPRGEKFGVRAGRTILTRGNPAETLMPIKFPPPDPHTFQQSGELREMLQRGTGAYDLPGQMQNANRMAATSMSMVVGSMIKRSKRTLYNIERQLLRPLVQKVLWRYMQFDPERYPAKDYKFNVKGTMGIMAREFEQGQMVSLLSTVPGESPAFWMLMKGIYETSSIEDRQQMIEYAEQMLQKSLKPPPPDPELEHKKAELQFRVQEHQDKMNVEARKLQHRDIEISAEARRDEGEGRMQTATSVLQLVRAETEKMSTQSKSLMEVAKAYETKESVRLKEYELALEEIKIAMEAAMKKAADSAASAAKEYTTKAAPQQVLQFPEMKSDSQKSAEADAEKQKTEALMSYIQDTIAGSMPKENNKLTDQQISKMIEIVNMESAGERKQVMESLNAMQQQMAQGGGGGPQGGQPPQNLANATQRDPKSGPVNPIVGKPVTRDGQGRLPGVT
jgi:hypothetical protein